MTIDEAVAKLALDDQIAQGESVRLQQHEKQWVVSSPGKVILFGEHAVVYGVPALAASVSLRCYAIATPHTGTSSGRVGVRFVDIDAGDKEGGYDWDIDNLPWQAVPGESLHHVPDLFYSSVLRSAASRASEVPVDLEFLEEISRVALPEVLGFHARQASLAFLYLYMVFAKDFESTTRYGFLSLEIAFTDASCSL